MPIELKSDAVVHVRTEGDIKGNGRDGSTALNATTFGQTNEDLGFKSTLAASDGDLRTIDTEAEALALDPAANSSGNASTAHSGLFLLRWSIKLIQAIAARLPALVSGRIPVDGSGVTQPVSGTITANLGTIADVATQTTLAAINSLLSSGVLTSGGITVPVSAEFTRSNDTNAYAENDVVSNSTVTTTLMTFTNAVRTNGGIGYVTNARLNKSTATTTNASFRLYLYSELPASSPGDNAPFTLLYANRFIRLGFIEFSSMSTAGSGSDSASASAQNINLRVNGATGSRNIFGLLVARAAYTPGFSEQFTAELTIEQN